jgi:lipopolysaccharide/colanic/teichoic acid biosynthesis glycosyltransferase
MIMIAVAIKLTSKGPVLFKQERYGHLGKPFIFLKFRTMHINSDSSIHENYVKKLINGQNGEINKGTEDKPVYKMSDDPRVTKIGGFLRASSLDELPQFINVFKGDMSLIGPRPPIQYEVNEYKGWQYRRILEAKPGITGLWQVSGRNSTTFDEMVKLDIEYAQNVSFLLDLKILFKTIKAVLSTKGC